MIDPNTKSSRFMDKRGGPMIIVAGFALATYGIVSIAILLTGWN